MADLDDLRLESKEKAVERMLELILPSRSFPPGEPGFTGTREKFRSKLLSGALDERKVEIEFEEEPEQGDKDERVAFDEVLAAFAKSTSRQVLDVTVRELQDFLAEHLQPLARRRREVVTVREAIEVLGRQEYETLKASRAKLDYQTTLLLPSSEIVCVQNSLVDAISRDPSLLFGISHRQFEEFIRDVLSDLGYEVVLTAQTRDGGCDLVAFTSDQLEVKTKYVIEAKHFRPENKVGVGAVRQLSAVRQKFGAHHGLLVTTSSFTKDAIRENNAFYGLHLRDYDSLLEWLKN